MKMIVGVDYSKESASAAQWAFQYAKLAHTNRQHIELEIVFVAEQSPFRLPTEKPIYEDPGTRHRMEEEMREFIAPFNPDDVDFTIIFLRGNPAQAMKVYVGQTSAFALVVGMAGMGRFARTMVGSTAHRLAHNPPSNLIIVHPDKNRWNAQSNFMVAVDFSAISEQAILSAIDQAKFWKATLHIVHVVLPPRPIGLPNGFVSYSGGGIESIQAVEQDANNELQAIVKRYQNALKGIEYRALTRTGYPKNELVRYANENSIDAIFMGTHGRGAVEAAILGSVTHGVFNQMPCSMILTNNDS